MEFRFFYPSCGQKLKADEEHAGQRADCPHCGVEFVVCPWFLAKNERRHLPLALAA
jgi:hypothetical protein